jgi:hypothetical protein
MPPKGDYRFGVAEGLRLFVAFRRDVPNGANEGTFGIEFQPQWFRPLPLGQDYRRWRLH